MPFDFFKYDFKLNVGLQYPFVFDYKGINATLGRTIIDVVLSGVSPLVLENAIQLNYLKLFGGCEQRNLPDNYIERQFIYMMDGSYIKVEDLLISAEYHVEYDFQTTSLNTNLRNYIGGRANGVSAGGGFRLSKLANSNNNRVVLYGFETGTEYYDPTTQFAANTRYKYTYNNGVCTLESGGSVVSTQTFTVTDNKSTNWGINAYVSGNNYWQTDSDGIYVYSLKVWNGQGELVMNLVPAVQKGTVPVVGFYDTVSKTFKTATSGTFAAGGEAVPTPDIPMDIVSNNGVLKAKHQSGLPLSYTLLDSVVFDSTQVIDTGFTPDKDSRIESKCYRTGDDCWFYGASPSNPRVTLYHSRTGTCRWGYQSWSSVGFLADTEYTIIEDKNGLNINGVDNPWTSGDADDFTCDRSLTIGNCNGATGTSYFAGNLYYMKIYDNNVLVRDFVPCQNASNVVGLYDKVNGIFYTDTGLVAGNLVSDPVEIYTDGTVETIALNGGTATAEMLLKVGNYQDVQSILDGEVTRQIGIKVLDGTEDWTKSGNLFYADIASDALQDTHGCYCTHFQGIATNGSANYQNEIKVGTNSTANIRWERVQVYPVVDTFADATAFKTWLADQYAAGTPVIIIYPLATATTESVTGQTLTASGNCIAEITQASMSGLEMELSYKQEQ